MAMSGDSRPVSVLVVDDDEAACLAIRDALQAAAGNRYQVEWATTYPGGQAAVAARRHDVYLFDYSLPQRSGLDLLREARANGRAGPVILVTGHGGPQVDFEAMAAGAADYLVKGQFDAFALERAIRYALEQKRSEEALRAHQAELEATAARLRQLARRLMEVQETERRRVACELHDEFGQSLTALKINLETARREAQKPDVAACLEESVSLVERMLGQVRDLSLQLHPSMLDHLGLVPALQCYCERHAERTGIPVALTAELSPGRLPSELETACFRIVQEALTNTARHARAHRVSVALRHAGDWLELEIDDDGNGFDVEQARRDPAAGLGLTSMAERAAALGGSLSIYSAPGAGTRIRARFPLAAAAGKSEIDN